MKPGAVIGLAAVMNGAVEAAGICDGTIGKNKLSIVINSIIGNSVIRVLIIYTIFSTSLQIHSGKKRGAGSLII